MEINYRVIIKYSNDLGFRLSGILRNGNRNLRLKVAFDLLKKICSNVWILSNMKELRDSTTSVNLIYRSVVLDLMTTLFLLHINDQEFEYSIRKLDVDHVKYMKDVLPMRLNLGKKIFNPQENEDIKEQDLFDQYYDNFECYIKSEKGEPWRIVNLERPDGFTFNGTAKSIYEYLVDCTDNENLQALSNLYMYYKYLSQTEHYSYLGNKYPFDNEHDDNWYKELDIVIYAGLSEMDLLLKSYY